MCYENAMARPYTLKRRAERQEETRLRIVEAAVELHSTIGPGLTTISQVAERAGVQRHTFYAHFPDELSLHMACSGLVLSRDPLPDAAAWRGIVDPGERLTTGLAAIHAWYACHETLMGCVLRDAEHHAVTREIGARRIAPVMEDWLSVLGDGLAPPQRAMLRLATTFFTWRTLAREAGLPPDQTVTVLVQGILAADAGRAARTAD